VDSLGDRPAVHRLELQGAEDQQVEHALDEVGGLHRFMVLIIDKSLAPLVVDQWKKWGGVRAFGVKCGPAPSCRFPGSDHRQ
jgi:hypothetical protein